MATDPEPASEPDPIYKTGSAHLRGELVRIDLLIRRWLFGDGSVEPADPQTRRVPAGPFLSVNDVDRLLLTGPDALEYVRTRRNSGGDAGSDEGTADPAGEAGAGGGVAQAGESAGSRAVRGDSPTLHAVTRTVRRRASRSVDAGVDLRLCSLAATLGLTQLEFDAFVCALAPEIDPAYGAVYGFLRDDLTATRPTVDLVARLLMTAGADRLSCYRPFGPRSPLVRNGIMTVDGSGPFPGRAVRVPDRVVRHVLGDDTVAEVVADTVTVGEPTADRVEPVVTPAQRDAVDSLADVIADRPSPSLPAWMHGTSDTGLSGESEGSEGSAEIDDSKGSGAPPPPLAMFMGPDRRTAEVAVDRIGTLADVPIIRYDPDTRSQIDLRTEIAAVRREAVLRGGLIHVVDLASFLEPPADREDVSERERSPGGRSSDGALRWLLAELDRFSGPIVCSGDREVDAAIGSNIPGHRFTRVPFPRPDVATRRAAWESVDGLPADLDPSALADTYRLTVGDIEDAAAAARVAADGSMTTATLRAACQRRSRGSLGALAREVEPTYRWEDLVLPPDRMAHLREVAGAIRRRGTVFEEWGFAERFGRGNGISVLFTGKSGTGKTMAAEVIAADVGLPLYTIDLSRVLSKYIGETERNLGRTFDAAADGDCILFFDEADALFGTRTEIGDAHDRYANVEVDYLLQRLEEYDGCVILASNLKENIDEAFKRRINAAVSFPMPDEAARRAIWERTFPDETPTDGIDPAFLARFDLSGGTIKNVATTAAFLAAGEESPVGMTHVVRALRREFQKTGKLYDVESFGPYREVFE